MSSTKTEIKELPYGTTKSELVIMYVNQMRENDIIKEINTIIVDNRKDDRCKNVKRIWHIELQEFVAIHGLPKGYTNPYEKP